ncbi:hypothetical protein J3T44_21770, partial [Salmonella enterica]|nr:hypothetical protein [Salmonella enterica]
PSQAKPSQAKPSQAKPSQAKPSQAKPSQAKPSQAKPINIFSVFNFTASPSCNKERYSFHQYRSDYRYFTVFIRNISGPASVADTGEISKPSCPLVAA